MAYFSGQGRVFIGARDTNGNPLGLTFVGNVPGLKVSLFVVAFAVYPIAAHLFKESGTPKFLVPGSIALGAFTFTMTALPGTPQIQNAIPMPFFKTTVYAAPILGTICGAMMFALV